MPDAIDRVGLGVDLVGGSATLAELKQIRVEMEAIVSLTGRSSNGGTGNSQLSSQARANKAITDEEVERYADAQQRKVEVRRRADAVLLQREATTQAELTRIQLQGEAERERALLRQRNSFSRTSSPALASQINRLPIEDIPVGTRSGIGVIRRVGPDPYGISSPYTSQVRQRISEEEDFELQRLREEARARRASNTAARGPRQTYQQALDEANATAEQTRLDTAVEKARQRRKTTAYVNEQLGPVPRRGSGGSGGDGGEEGDGPGGGGGSRGGVSSAVSRITRNLLIYEGIRLLTTGTLHYVEASFQAAKATTEQGLALKFATEAAGGNLEANRALSTQLQSLGYNRAQSAEVIAQAARATFRHPEQTEELARLATDIAASRGGGLQSAHKVIEDIQEGRARTYREYFNATPEDLYKKEAEKVIANRTSSTAVRTIGTSIDARDYKTLKQLVSEYTSALTEEEKEQIRLNFALSQAYRFQGDAIERAGTLAGKMDLVGAAFFNASANVGAFIADLRPVKELIDTIAGSTPGSIFTPPQIRQGGSRNTITDANVIEYGADSSTSNRANIARLTGNIIDTIWSNLTLVNTAFAIQRNGASLTKRITGVEGPGISDVEYDRLIAENVAKSKQVRQREALRQEGQLGYRALNPGDGPAGLYSTYEQLTKRGLSGGDILKNYIEDVKPLLTDGAKSLDEYRQKRQQLIDQISKDQGQGYENKTAQEQLNRLDAARDAELIGKFKPLDYDKEALKREDERKIKQQKERDKFIQEQTTSLAKLRDASAGSFKLINEVGIAVTGPDNPFTKILSDQITAAVRMQQQWGFLSKAAVEYFTTLERTALNRQLNVAEFGAYTTATKFRSQAEKERAERNNPLTLSRKDQEYLDIQSAIVDKAVEIPKLWAKAAEVLGYTVNPLNQLQGRIRALQLATGLGATSRLDLSNVSIGIGIPPGTYGAGEVPGPTDYSEKRPGYSQTGNYITRNPYRGSNVVNFPGSTNQRVVEGFSTGAKTTTLILPDGNQIVMQLDQGRDNDYAKYAAKQAELNSLDPTVRGQLQQKYADAALAILDEFTPAQIRQAGLQGVYAGAINAKAQGLQQRIEDSQKKAELGAIEDSRLKKQLDDDARFRAEQIAKGRDAGDVGKESDKLLLARTEGIPSKDLSYDTFASRQEALRREAERATQDQAEAKAAIQKGLEFQASILKEVQTLRTAVLGGSVSAVIKIENDTQARTDKEALESLTNQKVNIDERGVKSSAYTPSTEKYKRTGGKYGLTNR